MDFRGEGRSYQPSLTEYKRAYYDERWGGGYHKDITDYRISGDSGKFYCDMATRQNPPTLPSLGRVGRSNP